MIAMPCATRATLWVAMFGAASAQTVPTYSATLAPYGTYTGTASYTGTITVANAAGNTAPGTPGGCSTTDGVTTCPPTNPSQVYTGIITGDENACVVTTGSPASSGGCQWHVHSGSACTDNTAAGGHYQGSSVTVTDLWADNSVSLLNYGTDGANTLDSDIAMGYADANGYATMADVVGKPIVVHDASGGRAACGIITAACGAGYALSADSTACDADLCAATDVANSNSSATGIITGVTGDTVSVDCDQGYSGGGTWTCGTDAIFAGAECSAPAATPPPAATSGAASVAACGLAGVAAIINSFFA
jgi:hypothetical protein